MSELSNYIELLLREDMPKPAKERIADMIKGAEEKLSAPVISHNAPPIYYPQSKQAPSTLAIMARHGITEPEPVPVEHVAQTAVTAQAVAESNKIKAGIKPPMTAEGRPRKF